MEKTETTKPDPFDQVREALSLTYDYPADSLDPERADPAMDAAFKALDLIYLDLKYTQEALRDAKELGAIRHG